MGPVGKLEGVQGSADRGPELVQNRALQGLHDVGRQGHWSVVLLAPETGSLVWGTRQDVFLLCLPFVLKPLKGVAENL